MKKALSFILSIILLLTSIGVTPLGAFADTISSKSALNENEFSNQLSDLLSDYNDDYFGEVKIDIESNTIEKDGEGETALENLGVDYSQLLTDEPVAPVTAVMQLLGERASLDEKSGEVNVDGETYSFADTEVVESGKVISADNGIINVEKDGSVVSVPANYMTDEQAKESFALDMKYDDGIITVTAPYQTKRLIVQSKGTLKKTFGAVVHLQRKDGYSVLQYANEKAAQKAAQAIKKFDGVDYVIPDRAVSASSFITEREGAEQIQSDRYREYLKQNGKTANIKIAVVDTGIDTSHEMLAGRCLSGFNAFTKGTNVYDDYGHGTHCAGIIADNTPDSVKLLPVKVLDETGSGTDLSVAAGIDWAVKNKVNIISMSLGGLTDDVRNDPISLAVQRAYKAGIAVVCAAGNNYGNTHNYSPAGVSECITVASVSTSGYSVSNFSNFGNEVDVAAPGENILSCVPGNGYERMSGTSMACPFVSAAAALLLINNPSLTPTKLEEAIKATATDMLTEGFDIYSGEGIINFGMLLGDSYGITGISLDDEQVNLTYFSKATGYFVAPRISYNYEEKQYPTDATYTVTSSDSTVAEFKGRHIAPLGAGETTITLTTKGGASCSVKVICDKKEVWIDYAASSYAGGNGTKSNPYQIATPQQLAKLAVDTRNGVSTKGKYYKLTKDIDLGGKDWISIMHLIEIENEIGTGYATQLDPFCGNFDGNYHKIKNMTVFSDDLKAAWSDNRPLNYTWYNQNEGLFGWISNATIKNLGIENGYVADTEGALLCGQLWSHTSEEYNTLENIFTSGFSAGCGIFTVAFNGNCHIKNCYSSATVLGAGICYGSLPSKNCNNIFENVFFCGDFAGIDNNLGGLGFMSYAQAYEDGRTAKFYNCFSTAVPDSGIGWARDTFYCDFYSCYYNSSCAYGLYNDTGSLKLKSKNPSFFKSKANFTNTANWNSYSKWDFTNVWAIDGSTNDGYPYLKKMKPEGRQVTNTNTWLDYAADSYAGGKGTKDSPYLIKTAEQLARIAKLYRFGGGKGLYFSIENDIDLSAHNWYPIGAGPDIDKRDVRETGWNDKNIRRMFRGNINGNNHTISGLKVKSSGDYIGFISILDLGSVVNLNFTEAEITGRKYLGIVCGEARHMATVANVSVTGSVTALEGNAGGICGLNLSPAEIVGCRARVNVISQHLFKGFEYYSGGIVGFNQGTVERCYTENGTVLSGDVGGVCGSNNCLIYNCYTDSGYDLDNNYKYNSVIRYSAYLKNNKYGIIYNPSINNATIAKTSFTTQSLDGFDLDNVWQLSDKTLSLRDYGTYSYSNSDLPTTKWSDHKASGFAGGKGTFTDPYLIATPQQLALMVTDCYAEKDRAYRLTADLDMSSHIWDNNYEGNSTYILNVDFDGNGHTIKNLYFSDNGCGLFPFGNMGNIFDLNIDTIKGYTNSSIIDTLWYGGCISNCHVKNAVVYNAISYSNINEPSEAGGIAANSYGATIERCSFEGEVYGEKSAGGITGFNTESTIKNCYAIGTILCGAGANCIGHNSMGSTIYDCNYGICDLIHGLDTCNKTNYFSAPYVSPTTYYNILQKEEMQKQETFEGWDFDKVWSIDPKVNNGYPTQRRESVECSVTYVTNGGTVSGAASTYRPYHAFKLPTPKKNGYRFDGWYYDSKFTKKADAILGRKDTGDITLYAKWTAIYYVQYKANGAKGAMPIQTVEANKSTVLSKNKFKRTGYVFLGWSTSKNGKVAYKDGQKVTNLTSLGKTATLWAKWKSISYKVKFDNDLTGKKHKTVTQKGFVYGKAKPLRKNTFKSFDSFYVFAGWKQEGTSKKFVDGAKVKNLTNKNGKTVKLIAIWVPNSIYTIRYNTNGGTLPKSAKTKIRAGQKPYTLPTPTRKGYKFVGWYKDKKCTKGKTTKINPWIENNVKLYAKWKKK